MYRFLTPSSGSTLFRGFSGRLVPFLAMGVFEFWRGQSTPSGTFPRPFAPKRSWKKFRISSNFTLQPTQPRHVPVMSQTKTVRVDLRSLETVYCQRVVSINLVLTHLAVSSGQARRSFYLLTKREVLSFYVCDKKETWRGCVGCRVKFLEIEISSNFFLERTALEMFRWGCSDPARIRNTLMAKNGTSRPEKPRNSVLPEGGVKKRYTA